MTIVLPDEQARAIADLPADAQHRVMVALQKAIEVEERAVRAAERDRLLAQRRSAEDALVGVSVNYCGGGDREPLLRAALDYADATLALDPESPRKLLDQMRAQVKRYVECPHGPGAYERTDSLHKLQKLAGLLP